MSGGYIVIIIGCLYMVWCGFVAVLTFLKKNEAVLHLDDLYVLGFAALYAICAPFGLAGILGALNRNKSLIKGFLFQYWIGTLILIGVSVVSVILSRRWAADTLRNCVSFAPPGDAINTRNSCNNRVKKAQLVTLISASVQGGILILLGIILVKFGSREFQDIALDEENSNLLEKSPFGKSEQDVSEPSRIYRAPSNASSIESNGLLRRPTNASSYRGGLSRQPTLQNQMPPVPGLNRHPTNASNSSRGYPSYSTGNAPAVQPIKPNYFGRAPLLVPEHAYPTHTRQLTNIMEVPPGHQVEYNNMDTSIYSSQALANGTRSPTPPFYEQHHNEEDYTNYWQPVVAKTMASDLTRKGLY